MINSKAIFDVLKKIASRSNEIRRSDPLPLLVIVTWQSMQKARYVLTKNK